jgi:DNA mismatch repair ATPase MutL
LLAEKLKVSNEELYNEQLKKLSLHFSNPLWLDFLLNGYKKEPMLSPENENVNSIETIGTEERQEYVEAHDPETVLKSEAEIIELIKEENSNVANEQETITSDSTAVEERQEYIEVPEQANTESETELSRENINSSFNENPAASENSIVGEKQEGKEPPSNEMSIDADSEIAGQTEQRNDESHLSIPLPELNQEPEQADITFEPYHTVDYFASQGIKFIPEEKPADRFGQQLKSFTEWLKAMKRFPQTESIKVPDIQAEEKVQQLADHSVTEAEVSTEAMAEVWLKQGNKEKAIEIYNRLSLLNPAKSAYFASLAEQLKNS